MWLPLLRWLAAAGRLDLAQPGRKGGDDSDSVHGAGYNPCCHPLPLHNQDGLLKAQAMMAEDASIRLDCFVQMSVHPLPVHRTRRAWESAPRLVAAQRVHPLPAHLARRAWESAPRLVAAPRVHPLPAHLARRAWESAPRLVAARTHHRHHPEDFYVNLAALIDSQRLQCGCPMFTIT